VHTCQSHSLKLLSGKKKRKKNKKNLNLQGRYRENMGVIGVLKKKNTNVASYEESSEAHPHL
tara:strand:- start:799 stop:984 length:186 start_codon:yes stop_codon:yes gene_type:complete